MGPSSFSVPGTGRLPLPRRGGSPALSGANPRAAWDLTMILPAGVVEWSLLDYARPDGDMVVVGAD